MSAPIRIVLNGAPREFPAPLTFSQLLEELALAGRRLAVERNGEIIPRSRELLGVAGLSVSGWLGGELVYVQGVAVQPDRAGLASRSRPAES